MMRWGTWLVFVWLGSSCVLQDIDFSGTNYQCPDGITCPEGLVCHQQRCVETIPIDAGPDGSTNPLLECGEPSLIADDLAVKPYWMAVSSGNGSLVFENGRARATTSATLDEAVEFGDENHIRIADRRVSIEVLNVDSVDVIFSFYEDRIIELELSGGVLTGRITHGDETTFSSMPYNPALHQYWGLSAREGSIYVEVSGDGLTWTTVHSQQVALVNDFGSINVIKAETGSMSSSNVAVRTDVVGTSVAASFGLVETSLGGVVSLVHSSTTKH